MTCQLAPAPNKVAFAVCRHSLPYVSSQVTARLNPSHPDQPRPTLTSKHFSPRPRRGRAALLRHRTHPNPSEPQKNILPILFTGQVGKQTVNLPSMTPALLHHSNSPPPCTQPPHPQPLPAPPLLSGHPPRIRLTSANHAH